MANIADIRRTLIICAALVLVGAGALWLIFSTEPVAERETAVRQSAVPVDVIAPEEGVFRPVIEALGSVQPARQIELRPQVGGQVVALSESLDPGDFVRQGEMLLRIEDADYRNTLAQRQSELQQAIAELELERGRGLQAAREYRQLKADRGEELDPASLALVLREPQLRSAEARVQAARAAEAQAHLDLERTEVRAPFDAQVLSRGVDLGSQVSAGEALAGLVGLEEYWVEATVPLDKLRWLQFSEAGASNPIESDLPAPRGSPVLLRQRAAWPEGQYREGRLDQLVGELEGGTRLARVLVVVDDPLARRPENRGQPPLIIGAFVETRIEGREITGALKLPRSVIRQNDTVWLMREGTLTVQPVEIVFEDAEFTYVTGGLSADDRVVTTNLATVKEGLRLRLRDAGLAGGESVEGIAAITTPAGAGSSAAPGKSAPGAP